MECNSEGLAADFLSSLQNVTELGIWEMYNEL